LLALTTQGTNGYHCYLRRPLSPEGDWKGRKIRGVIRALGGEPVVLPMGEVYAGLERGVMDGSCGPAAGMLALKHYEVAKYRIEPTYSDAMGVAAEIGQHLFGAAEWWFGVDHPVEAPEFAEATCEGLRFGKIGEGEFRLSIKIIPRAAILMILGLAAALIASCDELRAVRGVFVPAIRRQKRTSHIPRDNLFQWFHDMSF
jgi:Bacterial extracellular solute-binding protein, family 7